MRANERAKAAGPVCTVPCFKGALVADVRRQLPDEATLRRTKALFTALADQQRLKIMLALRAAGELCVCDVAHVLGASISVASHHLRKLRDLGILQDRDDGKMTYYSLRTAFLADVALSVLAEAA